MPSFYVHDDSEGIKTDFASYFKAIVKPSTAFHRKAPMLDPKTLVSAPRIPNDLSRKPPRADHGFGEFNSKLTVKILPTTPFNKYMKPDPTTQFRIPSVGKLTPTTVAEDISPRTEFMVRVKRLIDTLKISDPSSADLTWLGRLYMVLETRLPNSAEISKIEALEKSLSEVILAVAAAAAASATPTVVSSAAAGGPGDVGGDPAVGGDPDVGGDPAVGGDPDAGGDPAEEEKEEDEDDENDFENETQLRGILNALTPNQLIAGIKADNSRRSQKYKIREGMASKTNLIERIVDRLKFITMDKSEDEFRKKFGEDDFKKYKRLVKNSAVNKTAITELNAAGNYNVQNTFDSIKNKAASYSSIAKSKPFIRDVMTILGGIPQGKIKLQTGISLSDRKLKDKFYVWLQQHFDSKSTVEMKPGGLAKKPEKKSKVSTIEGLTPIEQQLITASQRT